MKKPYYNQEERFIATSDTLKGNSMMLHLKWKLFTRALLGSVCRFKYD